MPLSNTPRIGKEFEQQTAVLLERVLPHCYLQGVPIFRADAAMLQDAMANELDFIVHLKHGRRHTLLIIECKAVLLTGRGDGRGNYDPLTPSGHWLAHYDPEKQIKEQLRAQRQALLTNLVSSAKTMGGFLRLREPS